MADKIDLKELSEKLNRHPKSIVTRIQNLKTGRNHKDFTKEEDMMIIDTVVEQCLHKDLKHFNFDIIQIHDLINREYKRRVIKCVTNSLN